MKKASEFWSFVRERESIRLRRADGMPAPWTKDPVLRAYKFTNVKRQHDRTTRGLAEIYAAHAGASEPELWLNCALYRYFGTVETAKALGWYQRWGSAEKAAVRRMTERRLAAGERVFTGAYIVPNCGSAEPKHVVVSQIVDAIWQWARQLPLFADQHGWSWQERVRQLTALYGVGSFMAKEIALDYVLATSRLPHDWQTWTPVGPGARRGAYRVVHGKLDKPQGLSEPKALEVCQALYAARARNWEVWWGHHGSPGDQHVPELDLTDVQFQLCEYDKWCRVREGTGKPRSTFRPSVAPLPGVS